MDVCACKCVLKEQSGGDFGATTICHSTERLNEIKMDFAIRAFFLLCVLISNICRDETVSRTLHSDIRFFN